MIARERAEVIGGAKLAVQTVLGPTPPLEVLACDPEHGRTTLHYSGLPSGRVLRVSSSTGELTPVLVELVCWECGDALADVTGPEVLRIPEHHRCAGPVVTEPVDSGGRWLAEGSPEYRLLAAVEDSIAAANRRDRE